MKKFLIGMIVCSTISLLSVRGEDEKKNKNPGLGASIPEVTITCDSSGSGQCYYQDSIFNIWGMAIGFECKWNGNQYSYCY